MPPRNLTIIFFTAALSLACYYKVERNRYAGSIAEVMDVVSEYYVEEVDSRTLYEEAMAGMVSGLDQYSAYIGPDAFNQLNASLDQEFGGVGIEVEKKTEEPLLILSPLVGTPADRAGLRAGDRVLEVDGQNLIGVQLSESAKLMRGKPGTQVSLLVSRKGIEEPFEVVVTREEIQVDSVLGDIRRPDGSWDFHLEEDARIGYLRVTTFGQRTVEEISNVLKPKSAENSYEAVILDLRGNAGGLLDAAVETCDLFIDQGRIVSTNGRHGQLRSSFEATPSSVIPADIPMAILVNQYSASASEIVAACLQDHHRAIVVGERSWGKGTVQNIFEVEGGLSAIKLTTATYWRPSGKNIHRREGAGEEEAWGVRPTEGYEVLMNDEDTERVFLRRRERDRYQDPAAADDGVNEEAVDDPQMRAAINYLKQQLEKRDLRSKTA